MIIFTDQLPTKPGAYWYRYPDEDTWAQELVELRGNGFVYYRNKAQPLALTVGGQWCGPLLAPDEVVAKEEVARLIPYLRHLATCGRNLPDEIRDACTCGKEAAKNRARKVVEGGTL